MIAPVETDARGIIAPALGLTRFRLDRYAPSPAVAHFVDRYWVVTWNLKKQEPFTQRVFAHPVVNVTFTEGTGLIHGVTTRVSARRLEGDGQVLGIMFRPGGFHPFFGRALSTITDQVIPLDEAFGSAATFLQQGVSAAADGAAKAAVADRFLAQIVPPAPGPSAATGRLVEWVASKPTVVRVERLAAEAELTVRHLQRRFAVHIGVTPKAVIRRYRLHETAEQARLRLDIDWARLALDLGYSDQAHLTRDFTATFGMPPNRYATMCGAPAAH